MNTEGTPEEVLTPKKTIHKLNFPYNVRAISDFENHVLVRMVDGNEYGMDLAIATRLLRDLRVAVDNAAGFDI